MEAKYTSNEKQVLLTDSFLLWDNQSDASIEIDCKPETDFNFQINFVFLEDPSLGEVDTKLETERDSENNVVTLKLYNINNPLGIQNLNPIPIAVINSKNAYLVFRVTRPDDKVARMINYTIYRDK